jgi:hypothetical protein
MAQVFILQDVIRQPSFPQAPCKQHPSGVPAALAYTPNMTTADLQRLKPRIPLLDYLQQRHWTARRVGAHPEFVGRCPLHPEARPSFYVNARKNLFYCHGCGRGGDLIRFVELSQGVSFRQSIAYLPQQVSPAADAEMLEKAAAFYQLQLHRHPEAVQYLQQWGCATLASSQNWASAMPLAATCGPIWSPKAMASMGCGTSA